MGIHTICIEPGAVETELTETITDDELIKDVGETFEQIDFLSAEDIVNSIY